MSSKWQCEKVNIFTQYWQNNQSVLKILNLKMNNIILVYLRVRCLTLTFWPQGGRVISSLKVTIFPTTNSQHIKELCMKIFSLQYTFWYPELLTLDPKIKLGHLLSKELKFNRVIRYWLGITWSIGY